MRYLIISCYLLLSLQYAGAQASKETLTNTSIITLHQAGIGKELIITKIQASICAFELNTEKLVQLKKTGIPDEVIEAMLTKGMERGKGSLEAKHQESRTLGELASGIYYEEGTQKFIELEPAVFSQTKQGSGILTSITYGLAKTKTKSVLSGEKANCQIKQGKPTFYFVFEKGARNSLGGEPTWFATASSPNEFVLIKLAITTSKKSREVVTGSYNSYEGLSAGIDERQKVPFSFVKVSPGIYKILFSEALMSGEYCFVYAGSASSYGGSPVYKVFDFGINQ